MIFRMGFAAVAALSTIVWSAVWAQDVYVNGYTRNDGTYVSGHYRSAPNHTKSDNWSQVGNVNPYTGKAGTLDCGSNCSNYGGSSQSFGGYTGNATFGSSSGNGSGLYGDQQ